MTNLNLNTNQEIYLSAKEVNNSSEEITIEKEKQQISEPPRYSIVLHNDDFTPYDFVVAVLQQLFGYSEEQAESITHDIHQKGKGIAQSNLTKDVAHTKAERVTEVAKKNEHPLLADIEKDENNS